MSDGLEHMADRRFVHTAVVSIDPVRSGGLSSRVGLARRSGPHPLVIGPRLRQPPTLDLSLILPRSAFQGRLI